MRCSQRISIVLVASAFMLAFSSITIAAPVMFSASGPNPASIQSTVDAFRSALGVLNPNVAGSFGSGRREINWDGVPAAMSAPNNLAPNFFNVNSPRGVVFSTPGSGFQVSANAADGPVRFDNLNPGYSSQFQTFSAQKLFTSLGSNILDVNFFVAGSTTPALVSGFGSVFTDIDLSNSTSIEYFDQNNVSLGTFFAQVANNGLSFLGVTFNAGERISRVRITSGNLVVGASENGTTTDVVVMDDFIYGEPSNIPEPTTMVLLGTGLVGIGAAVMKRKKKKE